MTNALFVLLLLQEALEAPNKCPWMCWKGRKDALIRQQCGVHVAGAQQYIRRCDLKRRGGLLHTITVNVHLMTVNG